MLNQRSVLETGNPPRQGNCSSEIGWVILLCLLPLNDAALFTSGLGYNAADVVHKCHKSEFKGLRACDCHDCMQWTTSHK